MVICENGYGKRTKLFQYRLQNRGGTGIMTVKVTSKTGPITASQVIDSAATGLVVTSNHGQVIRMKISDIPSLGRATQGVRVMRLEEGDTVAAATVLEGSSDDKEEKD